MEKQYHNVYYILRELINIVTQVQTNLVSLNPPALKSYNVN